MLPARQVQWHEKLMIKAKESGNTEYFLSVIDDDMDTFMILMKAFSKFKKWQQSSMQFILISSNDFLMDEINEKLSSYKYRNDVKLLTGASAGRSEDLVCAAYAFIYIQQQPISVSDLLSVMQNGTPVICSGNSELNGYSDDAVVQVEKNNAEALGDAMLHLYKNENTRTQKSEAGIQRVSLYKKEDQAQKLWSFLLYSAGGDI